MTSKEFSLLMCVVYVAAAASTPRDCLGYEPLRWMDDDDECHSNHRRRRQFAKEYRFLYVSTNILAEHLYKRQRRLTSRLRKWIRTKKNSSDVN